LRARETSRKKSKSAKKSKSPAKNSPATKSQYPWNVTEAQLTDGLDEDLRDAWHKLGAFAVGLGEQRVYASAQSIMFSKKVCHFFVRPRKKFLELWIFRPRKIEGLRFMQGPTKKEKYCNLFKVIHADQIEEPLTDWIREAFDFAPEQSHRAKS
jgi:Domain of unknown function (DUF5655)